MKDPISFNTKGNDWWTFRINFGYKRRNTAFLKMIWTLLKFKSQFLRYILFEN